MTGCMGFISHRGNLLEPSLQLYYCYNGPSSQHHSSKKHNTLFQCSSTTATSTLAGQFSKFSSQRKQQARYLFLNAAHGPSRSVKQQHNSKLWLSSQVRFSKRSPSRVAIERMSRPSQLLTINAIQSQPLTSPRPWRISEAEDFPPRRTQRYCIPQPRDTPPKRDTGIASEKEWGINLKYEKGQESGVNEDGGTWYRESGEDLGENGYRCRWTVMGGCNADGSSEWREAWWEKSDWTGYKELGAEKSGRNAQGDSWWETWQEILRQDEWSNLARIEKSAQKQAKSGTGDAGWYEKWWEKYNAKGWTEKGAHKYGRLNEQSWWEKWGEQYDGRGSVLKWTDKWAEMLDGTKWGDKWEEKFYSGMGTRQGETWHSSSRGERWSRTWGEEHYGNGTVHKYGKSTSGEIWDTVVEEGTYYESEPHYGWADAIGNSSQLLSIEPLERPPGVFPDITFSSPPTPGGSTKSRSPGDFTPLPPPPPPPGSPPERPSE